MTMSNGLQRQYVRAAMNAPFLEKEEEVQLARAWRDQKDTKALAKLTQSHMRLVIAVASKFKNYGLPMADLIQEGNIGVLEAANRFEVDRDVRFSTYATWWIRASIQDYILRNWSIVRGGTSSAQKALFFNLRRLRAKLAQDGELTGDEVHEEIARTIGINKADVITMDARLSTGDIALDAPLQDDGTTATRGDFIPDTSPYPEELVQDWRDGVWRDASVREALTVLNERELEIIRMRQMADDATTLEALGKKLGISKERVRQIESRALQKLAEKLANKRTKLMALFSS
jgi:RNA polymerase sigma-32 factor